jgi:hypothetical protein
MNSPAKKINPLEWYSIFSILVLTALIYSPVITNSFNGDDFGHLIWLREAMKQPELILRNFHSSWLDLTTAKFYRPLISIFMVSDYLVWHANGIGFHLTNLLCHLGNTFLVWLILRTVTKRQSSENSIDHYIWCIGSSALFGLYPLHIEAVSWITGRVDLFVTLFFLLSFLGYLNWRQSNKQKWLYISILAFVCSLLSKEMAIILPALIFMYELIVVHKLGGNRNIFKAGISAFKSSAIFWVVLIVYILWRSYALGTLVGGYDSTLLPADSWRFLLKSWKHSFYILFVPFNRSLFLHATSFTIFWLLVLATSATLSVKVLINEKTSRLLFLFFCSWFVLCLLPVFKLLNILDDLESNRLVYMATVPLSMLLCFGLSCAVYKNKKIAYWKITALALMLSAAGAGLLVNNSAWVKAESASKAILSQINEISKTTKANTFTYFLDLPDQINGAFVCRNALDGMTKYPQIAKDLIDCFNLSEVDRRFPFPYALQSMITPPLGSSCQFFIYKPAEEKLEQFNLPILSKPPMDKRWSGEDLKNLLIIPEQTTKVSIGNQGASFLLKRKGPAVEIGLNLADEPCFNIDFLVINCTVDKQNTNTPTTKSNTLKDAPLARFAIFPHFKNTLHSQEVRMTQRLANFHGQDSVIVIPMHNEADWVLGGNCTELGMRFETETTGSITIKSVSVVPSYKIMPNLSYSGNANQSVLGYIELSQTHPSCQISYDATKIAKSKNVILESSSPNQTFISPNDPYPESKVAPNRKLPGLSGSLTLTKSEFPELGIYALRLRAIGEDNEGVGIAGDNIIVTVR